MRHIRSYLAVLKGALVNYNVEMIRLEEVPYHFETLI